MTPADILAAALARSPAASAAVDARRAAEAAAHTEREAAALDMSRAEKRHQAARCDLISARANLDLAREVTAAHGALIELLNTDPTLIEDLHHLSQPPGLANHVTSERMSALASRSLIDRRLKPSSSVFSPQTILTAAGWATLRLYRDIIGAPLDSIPSTTTDTATPTEDR